MNEHRAIYDLQVQDHLRMIVAQALGDYHSTGKTLEEFEEDYGCTLIFDEIQYEHYSGVSGIWFQNDSSKTAFMLKYDL